MIRDIIYLFILLAETTLAGLRTILFDGETVNSINYQCNKRKSKKDSDKISFIASMNEQYNSIPPPESPQDNTDG